MCKALSYELAALPRMAPNEVTPPGSPDHAFRLLSKPTVLPGWVIGQAALCQDGGLNQTRRMQP